MDRENIKKIVETLIFITDKPLSAKKLVELINNPDVNEQLVEEVVAELQTEYLQRSAIEIRQVAEGYQMATKPEFSEYVRRLYRDRTMLKLSPAAVETLAIIAYRQPITKAEIEETRGVDCTAVLETLLERRLIRIVGRKEVIGRPLLYGTTQEFLKYFGLNSLSDLPPLEQFMEENIEISEENTKEIITESQDVTFDHEVNKENT
ncbi:MAG: SMC-Scp complex subunit ScpB [Endomicrobia bacterium]|nr:SMC-Scp complex subunit ScpB [Endomicrobiia bacterium]MCX7941056.1 SMC-Scp complex subunit ScpB [Endomicrobiia bacterium]MDW8055358.1 SMC-Scp complex subunit ScpB [Elusimicrobiota bacterium]